MSVLDKAKFSFNDFVKGAVLLCSIGSMWYNLKLDNAELKAEVRELKAYKDADDKAVNMRIEKLELLTNNYDNRANENEKNIVRILAVLNNYKLEIKNDE